MSGVPGGGMREVNEGLGCWEGVEGNRERGTKDIMNGV